MVSKRDLGILALLGIGAFVLSRGLSTKSFGSSEPAIPQNILRDQLLQNQFDELGETLESQGQALTQSQSIIQNLLNSITQGSNGLNQSLIPRGALLSLGQSGQPFRRAEQRARSSQQRGLRGATR